MPVMQSPATVCLLGVVLLQGSGVFAQLDVFKGLGETVDDLTDSLPELKVKLGASMSSLTSLQSAAGDVVRDLSVEGENADLKLKITGLKIKVENINAILPDLMDVVQKAVDKLPVFGNSMTNFPAKLLLRATVGALNTLLPSLKMEATQLTSKLNGELSRDISELKADADKVGDKVSQLVEKVGQMVSNLPNLDVHVGSLPNKLETL